ncbi:hypothetical protein [Longivirga aurantiaca]|uniref:Uncharacterized protein n=1 Tax=Longivirga aurantiaca TaxID=1837743 RepID=A0ABW1T5Q5_9ACTN
MTETIRVEGLHDYPQGEIFLLTEADGGYDALVYNTTGRGPCPDEAFAAIDVDKLRVEYGCDLVWKNPRRFWLMDALTIDIVGEPATLGGVDFNLLAKMHMPAGFDPTRDQSSLAYQPQQIHRTNVWEFNAGRQVHLLRSPDDVTWVMQTYTNAKSPDLTVDGLATLGDRLDLPEGWTYRTVTLDRDFAITTDGVANIVPDDLANMYQGLIDGVGSFDPWS